MAENEMTEMLTAVRNVGAYYSGAKVYSGAEVADAITALRDERDILRSGLEATANHRAKVEAERDALLRVVAAADAMHEAWYDGKDGEVARLMRDYDAPRAALKASD